MAQHSLALFKKLQSLSDVPIGQLAVKMGVIIDLVTHLPEEIWFWTNPKQADTHVRGRFTESS